MRVRGADSDGGGLGSRAQGGADGAPYVYPGLGEVCGGTGGLTGVFLGLPVRGVAGRANAGQVAPPPQQDLHPHADQEKKE